MARYKDAIEWLRLNEDRDMIDDFIAEPPRSDPKYSSNNVTVAMALVMDLFNKSESILRNDLEDAIKKEWEKK